MILFIAILLVLSASACFAQTEKPSGENLPYKTVALYGNSYVTAGPGIRIDAAGIHGWNDPRTVISTYFAVAGSGELTVDLLADKGAKTPARIEVSVAGERFEVDTDRAAAGTLHVGSVKIAEPGYVRVDLRGISGRGEFGRFTGLKLSGGAVRSGITAVPGNDADNWPYWGRRGPSVHMRYLAPADRKIRYFYNEVTVPEENDVLHSYFMVNGFDGGYMGIQVNAEEPEQRRILFSVWSGFSTDDPKSIPEAYRIRLLRKGPGVHVGEFGNEGSGGQSYLHYPWKAGKTYRFITEVVPDGCERTIFTGYFCDDDGVWRLVASFMRPEPGKTRETTYTGMHSFLENFNPEMGYVERRVHFGNQWAATADGEWIELTEGRFSVDNTGASGLRIDYDGGVEDGVFYLRNCGFFRGTVPAGSAFSRPATGDRPRVDLEALAALPSVE